MLTRGVLAVLLTGAAALGLLAVHATASSTQQVTIDFSMTPFTTGSSTVSGGHTLHERDAEETGIVSSGGFCCEVGAAFDRTVNLDTTRGVFSASLVIGGNPDDTVWNGTIHGQVTPDGATGKITATDNTGRSLTGTFTQFGHRSSPCCDPLRYEIAGTVTTP